MGGRRQRSYLTEEWGREKKMKPRHRHGGGNIGGAKKKGERPRLLRKIDHLGQMKET